MSDLPIPKSRNEQFLNAIATKNTDNLPTPKTRNELFLDYIARNGGTGGEGLTPSQLEKLNSIDKIKTELETIKKEKNSGITKWINLPNTIKSVYFAGDSTSDDTMYIPETPTLCLYNCLERKWFGIGQPLEGIKLYKGYATAGATISNYYAGTAPSISRNLNKLINDIKGNPYEFPLIILSLGLNGSSETEDDKYNGMCKIIKKILNETHAYILLRMPCATANHNDEFNELLRNLYERLEKVNFDRTSMLHTHDLLSKTYTRYIPNATWKENSVFSWGSNIAENGYVWKPSNITGNGISSSQKPVFPTVCNDTTRVVDNEISWRVVGEHTIINVDSYHQSQFGVEMLADLICNFIMNDKNIINFEKYEYAKIKNPLKPYLEYCGVLDYEKNKFTKILDVLSASATHYNQAISVCLSVEELSSILTLKPYDICVIGNNIIEIQNVNVKLRDTFPYKQASNGSSVATGDIIYKNNKSWICTSGGITNGDFPSDEETINRNRVACVSWGTAKFDLFHLSKLGQLGITLPSTIKMNTMNHNVKIYRKTGDTPLLEYAKKPTRTPNYIGEEVFDSANKIFYKARSLETGDWVALN